jgi:hypothetical protein
MNFAHVFGYVILAVEHELFASRSALVLLIKQRDAAVPLSTWVDKISSANILNEMKRSDAITLVTLDHFRHFRHFQP